MAQADMTQAGMTQADRLHRWNLWFDQTPEDWRAQIVLWPLVVLGALNMSLTIWAAFPFGLLVLLGILAMACVRLPYVLGWLQAPEGAVAPSVRIELRRADWMWRINQWYESFPELHRVWVILPVLLLAGVINMWLTASRGFPFGLLFLIALLVIVGLRAPYTAGWVKPPAAPSGDALPPPAPRIEQHPVVDPMPQAAVEAAPLPPRDPHPG